MLRLSRWFRWPRRAKEEPSTATDLATNLIVSLLQGHGLAPHHSEDVLTLEDGWSVSAEVFNEQQYPNGRRSAQLDVRIRLPDGRMLIESCAGIGDDRVSVAKDAVDNFMRGSLHVLLHAFWRAAPDDQVDVESWTVGEHHFRVVLGPTTGRGTQPAGGMPLDWFPMFESAVKSSALSRATHWIRVYYAQMERRSMAVEALLDNEPWESMQRILTDVDWPKTEEFYSVRFFMVLVPAG